MSVIINGKEYVEKTICDVESGNLMKRYVGKYCLSRSRNEGVNAGYVVAADETGVIMRDVRRLWYHKPANSDQAWYEGVANSGAHKDCRMSPIVDEKCIVEAYSLTTCSDTARKTIEKHPSEKS